VLRALPTGIVLTGYSLHERIRTLWTVSRLLNQRALPPTKALPKPVSFGLGVEACLDLVPMGIGGQIFALNSL